MDKEKKRRNIEFTIFGIAFFIMGILLVNKSKFGLLFIVIGTIFLFLPIVEKGGGPFGI